MSAERPYQWLFATEAEHMFLGRECTTLSEAEEELADAASTWNGARLFVRYEHDHDEHGEPWTVYFRVYTWDDYGELEFDRFINVENRALRNWRTFCAVVLFAGTLLVGFLMRLIIDNRLR